MTPRDGGTGRDDIRRRRARPHPGSTPAGGNSDWLTTLGIEGEGVPPPPPPPWPGPPPPAPVSPPLAARPGPPPAAPLGPPPAAGPATDPAAIRRPRVGRVELRRQLRHVARLRAATLIMVVVAIVGTPVGFFVIRDAASDPVFTELDHWDIPKWAGTTHHDEAYGSRWCYRECRFRERTWKSSRPAADTNQAFTTALRHSGWRPWKNGGCPPEGVQGLDSCWQRDEYVLDLWVRDDPCEIKPVRPTVGAAQPGAAEPSPAPSAEASGIPGPGCGNSQATVKVFNRIAYQHGT